MALFDNQKTAVSFCSPHRKIKLPNGKEIVDTITVDWHRARGSLALATNTNFIELFCDGLEVGVARTRAARRCLEHKPQPKYLFFLDDDVLPNFDAFTKLFFRAQTHPDCDIFAGVYCCKGGSPPDPLIYAGDGGGPYWDWAVGDILTTKQHGITGVHMGLTLIRVSLFQRMLDAGVCSDNEEDEVPFFKTVKGSWKTPEGCMQTKSGTEDLFFCARATAPPVNAQIMIDTSVLAGHIDKETGITWGLPDNCPPVVRARWLGSRDKEITFVQKVCPHCRAPGVKKKKTDTRSIRSKCGVCSGTGKVKVECDCLLRLEGGVAVGAPKDYVWIDGRSADPRRAAKEMCPGCNGTGYLREELKLALDLGAGSERREWPGYKTYTLDVRKDSGADYIQDMRMLNLPDNHYDLLASSHCFEHVPRYEQEQVWSEAFRVCKPGGKLEVYVPSLEWAAAKIAEGQSDGFVYDVLYGAQERHEMERDYNTHYMGYTKDIGRALAEQVGFVDVEVVDWRDNPRLIYNLIITGRKPEAPASEGKAAS